MKCDNCTSEATIHYTKLVDGNLQNLNLCQDCAREFQSLSQSFGLGDLLAGLTSLLGPSAQQDLDEFGRSRLDLYCENCGLTFGELQTTGKIGCATCYLAFAEQLKGLLKNIQGASLHSGKQPDLIAPVDTRYPAGSESLKPASVEHLRAQLQNAIEEQNFELAVVLRDHIRELERTQKG